MFTHIFIHADDGRIPCPDNCSGRGTCDVTSGICSCHNQFSGSSCEGKELIFFINFTAFGSDYLRYKIVSFLYETFFILQFLQSMFLAMWSWMPIFKRKKRMTSNLLKPKFITLSEVHFVMEPLIVYLASQDLDKAL